MDTIVKPRPAKQNTINERQDLRAWIAQLRAFGELQDIAGAEREKEIGGTGDMVIMRDPDTGWINYGAYRVQAHDRNVATVMCSKGKHGDLIKRRYHERGEPCPIAVVCGMHPALFMIAGLG